MRTKSHAVIAVVVFGSRAERRACWLKLLTIRAGQAMCDTGHVCFSGFLKLAACPKRGEAHFVPVPLPQVAQSAAGKEVKPKAMRMVAPAFDQETLGVV